MAKTFSISAFKQEMHYHPPWYNDQKIFLKLLDKKKLIYTDYITLSRLYIRYNHLDKTYLNIYFDIMLKKIHKKNINELLKEVLIINSN